MRPSPEWFRSSVNTNPLSVLGTSLRLISGIDQLTLPEGMTLGRRKSFRLRTEIPFSFIVTQAAQKGIVSQKACDSMIRNISEGGIAFDTNLSLKVGDELKVDVCLPGPTQMSAEG